MCCQGVVVLGLSSVIYVLAPPREGSQRCARRLDRLAVVIGEAMWAHRPAARTVGGLQLRPSRAVLDGQVLAKLGAFAASHP
jgi:hypothetical protein